MDPATHLVLPMLILLAARQNPRYVVPLAVFALFPDLDSLSGGYHRLLFHNIFVAVLIPLAFILYAKARKPSLVLPFTIILFYMTSHLLLDFTGVALLYPFYDKAFYFEPTLYLYTMPEFRFDFIVEWGIKDITDVGEYQFITGLGFVYIFILILVLVIFRKEMKGWVMRRIEDLKWLFNKFKNAFKRPDS